MAYLGDGKISVKKNNGYFIRNTPNNFGWERIKENNLLFIYGHSLHYDIVKSELSTITDNFVIRAKQPVQFNYYLEIPSKFDDYYFPGDILTLLFKETEVKRSIRYIERDHDIAKLHLSEPLFSNGTVLFEGEGIILHTKNKVILHNVFNSSSIYEANYHLSQEFTKNLHLPLMETNEIQFGPIASLYNKTIKTVDEAVEHSRISVPNLVCKTELLTLGRQDFEFTIDPPLYYQPQALSQVKNLISKKFYGYSYLIHDLTPNGYKLHLDHPTTEEHWNLNVILVPERANYDRLFLGFKDDKTPANESSEFLIEGRFSDLHSKRVCLNLYKPFSFKINKLICKSNGGILPFKLEIANAVWDQTINASDELYVLPLKQSFLVKPKESIMVLLGDYEGSRTLDITLECERV